MHVGTVISPHASDVSVVIFAVAYGPFLQLVEVSLTFSGYNHVFLH